VSATPAQSGLGPGGEAPLGTYGNSFTPPASLRQEKRTSRHLLKRSQRLLSDSKTSRLCWSALSELVTIDVGAQLVAHVSGIARCGSPWSCPLCAPVVRERRAKDIDAGVSSWLANGHGAAFITQTVRHGRRDELSGRLEVVARALGHCLRGKSWERRAKRLGYVGAIKAVEITHGQNGWHPHAHSLLLFESPLSPADLADLQSWLFARWSRVVERKGFGSLSKEHGVDVQGVTDSGALGSYLTKVEGGWGVGLELARADVKKSKGGRTPFEILSEFVETGESRLAALWREFESATSGKQAIVWSPGLRRLLLGDDQEVGDVEAAAAEGADLTLLRCLIQRAQWSAALRWGTTGELLTEVERCAAAVLLLARAGGHELVPIEEGR
jgi:hypothetical protein